MRVEIERDTAVAVVRPDSERGLTERDFATLREEIDTYLASHDRLHGLVVVVEDFPGWQSFAAFVSHIRFVRDHHRKLEKVALVSDGRLLTAAPDVVDHFVSARVRHFPLDCLNEARRWAGEVEDPEGGLSAMEGLADDVVAVRAVGVVTARDYDRTLTPLVKAALARHDRVKLLYWLGEDFKGFSAGAIWDDMRLGLMHLGDFSRVAVVTDVAWVRQSVKLFAPLLRADVQLFRGGEIDRARAWIVEG